MTDHLPQLERLKLALELAVTGIEQYQLDIRNSESIVGSNLADAGFCQGQFYRDLLAGIRALAGQDAPRHVELAAKYAEASQRHEQDPFRKAALEWLKGCSCASMKSPEACKECTNAFLDHLKKLHAREGLHPLQH